MLKTFSFECGKGHIFDDIVEGVEGKPDECPKCSSKTFTKVMSAPSVPTRIVVDYPGSKRFKAGYVHTHADRPREKSNSVYYKSK